MTLIYLLAPFSPKSLKYFGHEEASFFSPGTWNITQPSTWIPKNITYSNRKVIQRLQNGHCISAAEFTKTEYEDKFVTVEAKELCQGCSLDGPVSCSWKTMWLRLNNFYDESTSLVTQYVNYLKVAHHQKHFLLPLFFCYHVRRFEVISQIHLARLWATEWLNQSAALEERLAARCLRIMCYWSTLCRHIIKTITMSYQVGKKCLLPLPSV